MIIIACLYIETIGFNVIAYYTYHRSQWLPVSEHSAKYLILGLIEILIFTKLLSKFKMIILLEIYHVLP